MCVCPSLPESCTHLCCCTCCPCLSHTSQYMGALLFAAVVFRRRHKFGIPEALACAEDRFHEQRSSSLARSAGAAAAASTGGSSTLVAKKLGGSSRSGGLRSASAGPGSKGTMAMSPHKRGQYQQQQHQGAGRAKRHSRTSSADRSSSSPQRRGGISPRRSRESSGTLRIDLTAFEAQLAGESGRVWFRAEAVQNTAGKPPSCGRSLFLQGSCCGAPFRSGLRCSCLLMLARYPPVISFCC